MTNDESNAMERALEQILDAALAQYSNTEPLAGLEQRVINRVRAEGGARPSRFGRWALALGLAAAIIVAVSVWWMQPRPLIALPLPIARSIDPSPRFEPPAAVRPTKNAAVHVPREFPIPTPVSREERALLALVALAPDQAREALLDLQRRSTEPIQVDQIKIDPLRSDYENNDAN